LNDRAFRFCRFRQASRRRDEGFERAVRHAWPSTA
jgi:hypothetical protein